LRLFLIVLEKLVVAQGRWHQIAAGAECGARRMVRNSMMLPY
jgi:hypothetical protein